MKCFALWAEPDPYELLRSPNGRTRDSHNPAVPVAPQFRSAPIAPLPHEKQQRQKQVVRLSSCPFAGPTLCETFLCESKLECRTRCRTEVNKKFADRCYSGSFSLSSFFYPRVFNVVISCRLSQFAMIRHDLHCENSALNRVARYRRSLKELWVNCPRCRAEFGKFVPTERSSELIVRCTAERDSHGEWNGCGAWTGPLIRF